MHDVNHPRLARCLHGLLATMSSIGAAHAQSGWIAHREPGPRFRAVAAYDSVRDRVVVFGGAGALVGDETLEWDGVELVERASRTRPAARYEHALAFDAARQRTVLFSGQGQPADTWLWDGAEWQLATPATSPAARSAYGFAYDPARQRVVMFGGFALPFLSTDETWEWDGTDWSLRQPAVRPSARFGCRLAWDPAGGGVVLFGGQELSGTRFDETWRWDGSTWVQLQPRQRPPATAYHAMTTDPSRARIVTLVPTPFGRSTTWEWDGSNWSSPATTREPIDDNSAAIAPDGRGHVLTLFGSPNVIGFPLESAHASVWRFDGTDWSEADERLGLASAPGVVTDSARGRVVLIAGKVFSNSPRAMTWEWDGHRWDAIRVANTPPADLDAMSVCYDATFGRTLLFGGMSSLVRSDALWSWDGTAWTALATPIRPLARRFAAFGHHAASRRSILFGGEGAGLLGDTWSFDGVLWTQLAPAHEPSLRSGALMAYDPVRARLVLHGGGDFSSGLLSDTWEWDGVDWNAISATAPFPARRNAGLVFDATRQRIALATTALNGDFDVWEWDGAVWTRRPEVLPATLWTFGFDPRRGRLIGVDDRYRSWVLGVAGAAAANVYGTGCAGGVGIPTLTAWGQPTAGNPTFRLELGSSLPGTIAAITLGATATQLSLGACTLLVDNTLASLPINPGAGGFAVMPLPIPTMHSLFGASLFAQGLVLDTAGAFGGFAAFSNGVQITLGD